MTNKLSVEEAVELFMFTRNADLREVKHICLK